MEKNAQNSIMKRSPVVSIMGHIDHGKSTLLDYIRKTNIVAGEAGGITQRISAYEVVHRTPGGKEEKITFLDTPGHEAFSAMRISGTTVADIAVLVVSAEDGVKKQTLEALKAITDSGIPFIVAINKIDKPGANVEKTKNNLVENGIYIEGYGGSIPYILTSAKTGEGVSELMDMILLVAEMGELTADIKKPAKGFIIEAHLDKQKGITVVMVIKEGHLESGMYVVSGDAICPTRIMEDFLEKKIVEAFPSSPVRLIGFDKLPKTGVPFTAFKNKKEAEEFAQTEKEKIEISPLKIPGVEEDVNQPMIRLMIKAQVVGSIDAIQHEINKIQNDTVKIKVISTGIGNISENDVKLGSGRNPAVIIGFDVKVDSSAKDLAERLGVGIKNFDIIYNIAEWLSEEIAKKTPKIMSEEVTAIGKVLKTFSSMKDKHIIGVRVEKGVINVGSEAKIIRGGEEIGMGIIKELQKDKSKVSEVHEGAEFGCQFKSDMIPAPGDKLEIFRVIEK